MSKHCYGIPDMGRTLGHLFDTKYRQCRNINTRYTSFKKTMIMYWLYNRTGGIENPAFISIVNNICNRDKLK